LALCRTPTTANWRGGSKRQKALADLTAQEILVRRDATTQIAVAQLIEARRVGDIAGVATMMREIRQNDVETAKMLGLYEPAKVDVNLTQSLPALIADIRQRTNEVLDAEVVELKEVTR
jgi:hypothetical protein